MSAILLVGELGDTVIEEAVEHYLSINEWQVRSIQQGLKDIDHGRVVAHESMEKIWEGKISDTHIHCNGLSYRTVFS